MILRFQAIPFNPFYATTISMPPKKSENLWFSDIFRVYRKKPVAYGLKQLNF